jgi:predicted lipoprotein with Yx(FWY)xxD motif
MLIPQRLSRALAFAALLMAANISAQSPDKPPANDNMFESTQPPASDAESAAVMKALQANWSAVGPAMFVNGYMVDRVGMSLYVFDRDRPNVSTCYRACEKLWPPLLAGLEDEPVGDFGIIERLYGARQWTWRGQPLYYWPSDTKPGDRTGDNVSGVWHLVLDDTPAAASSRAPASESETVEPPTAQPAPKPRREPPPAQSEYEY